MIDNKIQYMLVTFIYVLIVGLTDKDIWSHGTAQAADLRGERAEDYYEILEELGRYVELSALGPRGILRSVFSICM